MSGTKLLLSFISSQLILDHWFCDTLVMAVFCAELGKAKVVEAVTHSNLRHKLATSRTHRNATKSRSSMRCWQKSDAFVLWLWGTCTQCGWSWRRCWNPRADTAPSVASQRDALRPAGVNVALMCSNYIGGVHTILVSCRCASCRIARTQTLDETHGLEKVAARQSGAKISVAMDMSKDYGF